MTTTTISPEQLKSLQNYHLSILAKTNCTLYHFANIHKSDRCATEKKLLDEHFPKIKNQPTINNLRDLRLELTTKLGQGKLLELVDTILSKSLNQNIIGANNEHQPLAK